MTLLQLQHHMTSLTVTARMEMGKSVGVIKEEMAGNVKEFSSEHASMGEVDAKNNHNS